MLPIGGSVPTSTLEEHGDLGITMEITSGGVVIPLSAVRPCGRRVPLRGPWTYTLEEKTVINDYATTTKTVHNNSKWVVVDSFSCCDIVVYFNFSSSDTKFYA